MKKFLFVLSLLFLTNPVLAKNIKVEALSDFSTLNPPKTWQIKIVESFVTENGYYINSDSILEGRIEGVKNAKRLKQNASFVFIPESLYDSKTKSTYNVRKTFVGKYNKIAELEAKDIAKKGAITAGNMLITPFIGPGVALVEGTIKNEKGNRAKSAVVSVYESTPLSYCNKGSELEFAKGDIFTMNFKSKD